MRRGARRLLDGSLDRFLDRSLDRFLDRTVSSQDEPLATFLEMSGISKRVGGVHALRDVELTLEVGEVHCLVGENGSGKSTLIKIISGVEAPERGGRIAISGTDY